MEIKLYQLKETPFVSAMKNVLNNHFIINEKEYKLSYQFTTDSFLGMDNIEILNKLYLLFNKDDRPNAKTSRALTTTDIIIMNNKSFIALTEGWKEIEFKEEETI